MRGSTWTAAEIDLLRLRRSQKVPVPQIANEIGRPVAATYARARIENILVMERKEWDVAEVARLIVLDDARDTLGVMADKLGRTENSVRWKLDDLGRGGKRVAYWSEDEEARLRTILKSRNAEEIDFEAVAAQLALDGPGRTADAVEARVRALGLIQEKRFSWNAALVARLKFAVRADAIGVFAAEIGRHESTVRARAIKLGLITSDRTWTEADVAELRADGDIDAKADRLGRSKRAVRAKMVALGIPLPERPKTVRAMPVRRRPRLAIVRPKVERPAPVNAGTARRPAVVTPAIDDLLGALADYAVARVVKVERPTPVRAARVSRAAKAVDGKVAARRQLSSMGDAIAAFMAAKGVTREQVDPIEQVVRDLRRKGYAVVSSGDGWLVDGRHDLANAGALMAFARTRAIETPALQEAAE